MEFFNKTFVPISFPLMFPFIFISVPAASSQKPEEVIQRYMEVVAAPLDEVNIFGLVCPLQSCFEKIPVLLY